MIDIHSHIIPGVDDGAKTFEDSLAIIRELQAQGITDIIATPHYVDETVYTSPVEKNTELLEELKGRLEVDDVEVNIYLGNEIYIDDRIPSLIRKNYVTTLGDGSYLLIELPMSGVFPNYEDIIGDLLEKNYKIILAHPERYDSVKRDYQIVNNFIDMGVLLQCNLGSLVGQYGKHTQKVVKKLIKEKLVFAFGSDIHHTRNEKIYSLAQKKLRKYYDEDELEKVLVTNPEKIIHNK